MKALHLYCFCYVLIFIVSGTLILYQSYDVTKCTEIWQITLLQSAGFLLQPFQFLENKKIFYTFCCYNPFLLLISIMVLFSKEVYSCIDPPYDKPLIGLYCMFSLYYISWAVFILITSFLTRRDERINDDYVRYPM